MTDSITNTINETNRRREIQSEYNKEHNITPKTIQKSVRDLIAISKKTISIKQGIEKDIESLTDSERRKIIVELTKEMQEMALELNFERAAFLRDKIKELNDKKTH